MCSTINIKYQQQQIKKKKKKNQHHHRVINDQQILENLLYFKPLNESGKYEQFELSEPKYFIFAQIDRVTLHNTENAFNQTKPKNTTPPNDR